MSNLDYDVVYFLTCQPVDKQGNVDKSKPYRSAVMHFGRAQLDVFNTGMIPTDGKDEFTWVTDKNLRLWEGFMYDVSFCEGDPKANHFRLMINPDGNKFEENKLCGWSAKVAPMHERSKMVPIYRADKGKLMHVGGYDCYREYFCTYAPLPSGTYKERCAKMTQRPSLWEKQSELPPRALHFRRMIAAVQLASVQQADSNAGVRDDMAPDVEVPLNLTGGDLIDAGSDATLADTDLPDRAEPGSKNDPDTFDNEKLDDRLYEEGDF